MPAAALVVAGFAALVAVPVAGLEGHEAVLRYVGSRSLEAAVPLAARLAAALERRHPETELLDRLDVELRAGLERRGEPAQLREVVELEGPLGGLADARGARVRGAVGAFALEPPAEHLLAVDEPQALAADLLGRLLCQAEHPVVPPRLGRVVGDVLQKELEAEDFKFGVITPESFTKVTVKGDDGVEERLGYEKSKQVYDHLVATGMVDDKGAVTPELKAAAEEGKVELPAELEPAKEQVEAIIIHKSQRVQIRDKAKEVSVELQKDVTLDPAFQALWDRIRQRTRFQVEVDSGKLIEHAIEAVDGMLAVRPPQVTSERASLGIDDAGVSAEGTGTSVVSVSGKVKYDLPDPIAELQDAVGLTRGTIKAILEGCSRLDEFEIDPATFLAQVGDKINRVKNDLIAQGIKYVRLPEDEWYTMRDLELDDYTAYLGQNAWKPDMTSKSLYNYVVYDSAGVERSFAEALDKQEEVLVFAKLPSAFKIDTPLGSYNPDWAYVEEADGERRVYFVTETKGGKNGEPALRDAEKIKIGCAKKHFEALDLGNDFHYNVRTTYQYEAVKA